MRVQGPVEDRSSEWIRRRAGSGAGGGVKRGGGGGRPRSFTIHAIGVDRLAEVFLPANRRLVALVEGWPESRVDQLIEIRAWGMYERGQKLSPSLVDSRSADS